jgi:predicted phosphodiesterase
MKILLLSDIHGNFPALAAIINFFEDTSFTAICNCGDSLVYAPFPNETLHWLQNNNVRSILGNTDRKVKKLHKTTEKRKKNHVHLDRRAT